MSVVPPWLRGYHRAWLRRDLIAGLVVWSVVVPQVVAYAQIAGLPPEVGLVAAPGALLGYALLGTSRTLIVSATTATSALSAAAVGPLAGGDAARFMVKDHVVALAGGLEPRPSVAVLALDQGDLDLETLDMLAELADALARLDVELRLAGVRTRPRELLRRSGLADRIRLETTLDAATRDAGEP